MAQEIWQPITHDDPRQDFGDLVIELEDKAARDDLAAKVRGYVGHLVPPIFKRSVDISLPTPTSRGEIIKSTMLHDVDNGRAVRALMVIAQKILVQGPPQ